MNGALVDDFDALVYPPAHQGTMAFLGSQVTNLVQNWGQGFTNAAQNYVQTAQRMYDSVYSEDAMRLSRAAIRKVNHLFQRDEIRQMNSMADLQNAPFKMKRWLMANPVARQAYHDQRIDGYSGSYIDANPGLIGRAHGDYMQVITGVVLEEGDDLVITHSFDEPGPDDPRLNLEQRGDILSAWDLIEAAVKAGKEDFSSVYGNNM